MPLRVTCGHRAVCMAQWLTTTPSLLSCCSVWCWLGPPQLAVHLSLTYFDSTVRSTAPQLMVRVSLQWRWILLHWHSRAPVCFHGISTGLRRHCEKRELNVHVYTLRKPPSQNLYCEMSKLSMTSPSHSVATPQLGTCSNVEGPTWTSSKRTAPVLGSTASVA